MKVFLWRYAWGEDGNLGNSMVLRKAEQDEEFSEDVEG